MTSRRKNERAPGGYSKPRPHTERLSRNPSYYTTRRGGAVASKRALTGPQALEHIQIMIEATLGLVENARGKVYAAKAAAQLCELYAQRELAHISSTSIPAIIEETVLAGKDDPTR
jgi:hypothetical protein